jgi:hypothetical protein
MPEKPYIGSEPLSFLRHAVGLVQKQIDERHSGVDAFISTYGFPPAGSSWLVRMQSVLNQLTVTALFGFVEGAAREHLEHAGASGKLPEWSNWSKVKDAFEHVFNCELGQMEGYLAVNRANKLANYFKHTGAGSWKRLVKAWPLCGDFVGKSEHGMSDVWAGIPVGDLIAGAAQFLAALQDVVDRSANARGAHRRDAV